MTRFDELPPEIQEAMCTPLHNILPSTSSHIGALYLGSLAAVVDADGLRALNITVIVQVLDVPWLVLTEEEGFTCYKVDIEDIPTQNLDEDLLERVCAYVDDMRNQGKSVLVHCQQVRNSQQYRPRVFMLSSGRTGCFSQRVHRHRLSYQSATHVL